MTVSMVIEDVIAHLVDNWDEDVTNKPSFLNGNKELAEGLNYIWVYNAGVTYIDTTADGTSRNEIYQFRLKVHSNHNIDKRDDMLSEVERIFDIVPTGYLYGRVRRLRHQDTPMGWTTHVRIELFKLVIDK